MGLQEDILRDLATEYKATRSSIAFSKILKRLDKLLLSVIYNSTRQHVYLQTIELRELYHTAIIALGKALLEVRPQDTGGNIYARIIFRVKNVLMYEYKPEGEHVFAPVFSIKEAIDESIEYDNISDIRMDFENMLLEGHITKEELDFVCDVAIWRLTSEELKKKHKMSRHCFEKRMKDIKLKMKMYLWQGV